LRPIQGKGGRNYKLGGERNTQMYRYDHSKKKKDNPPKKKKKKATLKKKERETQHRHEGVKYLLLV